MLDNPLLAMIVAHLEALRSDEEGQTFVEYALVLVLISLVIGVAVTKITDAITGA
jgi:Flp pilus assembly pilin Flp